MGVPLDVPLRSLLPPRAIRDMWALGWLLDDVFEDPVFKERMQWIHIQMMLYVRLIRKLKELGFIEDTAHNVRLLDCINIGQVHALFSQREANWLRFFNRQANDAKHNMSNL